MKSPLLYTLPLWLLVSAPAPALDFRKFGSQELSTQLTAGIACAGLGYLYLQGGVDAEPATARGDLNFGEAIAGISLGYTLGILFSGKIFQGQGNPFFTLIGNIVPLAGPLFAYHLSAGSAGFSESLALFNLHAEKLSLGLPIPYRKLGRFDEPRDAIYYLNLVIINL